MPFLLLAALLAIALPPAVIFGFNQRWLSSVPGFLYETTWLVAIFTTVIFVYMYRAASRAWFVQLYLLSMAVKLIAYFAYNLIMILDDRKGAVANVLYFLGAYCLFTALEITFLHRRIARS